MKAKEKKDKSNKKNILKKYEKKIVPTPKCKRKYRKRFSYSQEQLNEALNSVRNNKLTANRASKEYHIPKGTLINKLHETVPLNRKMGPPPVLTNDEEARIEKWIIAKAMIGYPMHPEVVKDSV